MALASSQYRRVEPARIEQRAVERHNVLLRRATVRGHGRKAVDAQLLDLSIYGCRVAAETDFKKGDRLWLRLSGSNAVSACVVWIEANRIGCRFDEPLEKGLFRALTLAIN
jgi:hypothetical protein